MESRTRRVGLAALMVVAWFGVLGPLASRRPLSALAGVDGDGNNDGGNASPPGAGAGDDDDDGGGSLATSSVSLVGTPQTSG